MKAMIVITTTVLLFAIQAAVFGEETATTAAAPLVPADTLTSPDTNTASPDTVPATAAPSPTTTADSAEVPSNNEGTNNVVVVKENLDTVFIFDKSVFRYVAKDWHNNIGIFRQRGYGIGGSSMYGANAIFTGPIKDLAKHDPYLAGKRFNFSTLACEPFLVSGGTGFVGLGEGFRLGGGGMSGQRKFTSNQFDDDSILVLNTKVTYGGFLVEKCMLNGRWNISAGGEIGGGSFNVTLSEQSNTAFYGPINDNFNIDLGNDKSSRSIFFMLEPHAAITYTFFYFLHIGGSISLPAFMSIEKFNAYTDDYFTVNPGLQVKLIFGNLG